jgi:3-deoxy-D-manno-octulosonic-acid transferase
MHAPAPDALGGLLELARRLREEDGCPVLLTAPQAVPPQAGLIRVAAPPDNRAAVRDFLDHWQPDTGILSDGELRPLLIDLASRRDIPLIMVNAKAPALPPERGNLWPGVIRHSLRQLDRVFALDAAAARLFTRRGATAAGQVRVEGRLQEGSSALPCTEAERAALVRQFRTRPVWLAAAVPEAEEAAVIAAHRAVLRLAHRLLLIIVPDLPERANDLAQRIEASEGWMVARRSADEEADEETPVFIADVPSEMGLWYRLAPVTYLGGSLSSGGVRRDPFEAAALGSAILHGPWGGLWQTAVNRLTEAQASRPVKVGLGLADGLADLLSPDRAARLAQAAWAATSAGAGVTDRVVLAVRELAERAR